MHKQYPITKRLQKLIRIAYIALISALVMGSASPLSAQAAPAAELVNFFMKVQNPKTKLRCGETVTYLVKVELAQSKGAPTQAPGSLGFAKGISVVGIEVEASSVDKKVGNFVGTGTTKTTVVFDDDLAGLGAKFKFKANKPGKTTLYFEGLVGKEYVSAKVDVKVLPCKFKVTTIGEWHVPGPANINIMAISEDAEVKAADEQSNFEGSATMNWRASVDTVLDCAGVLTIGNSQVNWTGEMDAVDRLSLNSTYQSAAGLIDNTCANAEGSISGTFQVQLTPAPVHVNIFSSGGVYRQSQMLQGPEASPGYVTIVVIPVEDEAAASIPANQETSWDDLSSLVHALLALY